MAKQELSPSFKNHVTNDLDDIGRKSLLLDLYRELNKVKDAKKKDLDIRAAKLELDRHLQCYVNISEENSIRLQEGVRDSDGAIIAEAVDQEIKNIDARDSDNRVFVAQNDLDDKVEPYKERIKEIKTQIDFTVKVVLKHDLSTL